MIAAADTSIGGTFSYLATAAHWHGSDGFGIRLAQHLEYCGETLLIATAIGLPLGLWTGHTRRGGVVLSLVSNASRALPTLGLLTIFALLISVGLVAAVIPLVVLAVPPILVNTDVGVRGVDAALIDAARGMGLRPAQVVTGVEVPVATPLVLLGLRTAAIQVVSTATIAGYVGLGGLGRYIIDGLASRNFAEIGAGGLLVAVFAIVVELGFLLLGRVVVAPGLRPGARRA